VTVNLLADLLRADPEYRRFFKRCCRLGTFRLQAQAGQFNERLVERRVKASTADVRDALVVLATKTLPATPAGRGEAGHTPSTVRTPRGAFDVVHDARRAAS
jgi:hypothetical protein